MPLLDLNKIVAYSLRIGVLAGVLLSLVGLASWAVGGFNSTSAAPTSDVLAVVRSSFSGSVTGIIYLGVFVLIATPVFRVAASAVYFSWERDKRYVGITLIVLVMLLFALFYGASV